ncbi:hypothetical protein PFBG_05524 [Plasmodium falciparum 7G8]|uniref:Glutaminyl-peptide cyclotransferase, putative n=5 Tax=Plasmodium falciparum TaxID=5833 RepID=A0A144A3U7_PLAF7|nr:glutaminyl-peptide cyclotransferase, putative [Plasmodium falciparum 3D7]ETW33815.1 hypothetical protein PFTANZ_05445 [Plasmodium falciparum Tanzania (2000708)]ETW39798.1 hypothetical protein PFNF135_05827 [Plasmodium falciparum NF135/5.C10]EUR62919.1 hypothetical protein PFBG_05524 [Plasmodium falciparum 7G8]KAF4329503.1 glutaminyl-peptide cyclotransferase [Plasmodium falciparum NF54]PKC49730.1 glutaminyl-peptide cyclotransferase [Plasmodium falciparum NF54]|eukprot:XP_001348621.2 glutaminyl-peptide cyclotransferase, putative [Plasmodium falciparum 3D7]
MENDKLINKKKDSKEETLDKIEKSFRFIRKALVLTIVIVLLVIVASVFLILHFINSAKEGNIFPYGIGIYTYKVLNTYDHIHDPLVGKHIKNENILNIRRDDKHFPFTQGLFFSNNETLIESTGLYNASYLREFDLLSGKTIRFHNLESKYFGEGTTLVIEPSTFRKFLFVLTYKEKKILVFNYETFELYHTYYNELDGYGLTSNVDPLQSKEDLRQNNFPLYQKLWATSGDEYLYELDIPPNLKDTDKLSVVNKKKIKCAGFHIYRVNELEYHPKTKSIFANIFLTDLILQIDVDTATCLKIIDLKGLIERCSNYKQIKNKLETVLNGIAIRPESRQDELPTLLVTGKLWSNIFEITFVRNKNAFAPNVFLKEYYKTIGNKI